MPITPTGKTWNLDNCGLGIGSTRGCFSGDPVLLFTDIISGPASGLGDGLGDGAIVTVWGQGLGAEQLTSKIYFRDSAGTQREAAHVYYWKNADGQAPGGPANLHKSHRMQEIAFSIPAGSVAGAGTIEIEVGGEVSPNTLPFTVRSGNIYWVDPAGDNGNDGSFASPAAFVNSNLGGSNGALGDGNLVAGDIVYSKGVTEPGLSGGGIECGMYLRSLTGTLANQIAFVGYPGAHSKISAINWGMKPYLCEGLVISKYHISVGNKDDSDTEINPGNSNASNFHVAASKNGRAVGNYMDEVPGKTVNGWSGAITSGGDTGSGFLFYGNHLYDLGNDYTSHYHHTTYLSVRDSAAVGVAWGGEYNFLENCKSKFGVHFYDESYSGGCGTLTGTLKCNFNVITNQKGRAINIDTRDLSEVDGDCWSTDIEILCNVLINCGLGPVAELGNGTSAEVIRVGGDIAASNVNIDSNTIYKFSDASSRLYATPRAIEVTFAKTNPNIVITNNAMYNDYDAAWFSQSGVGTVDTADSNAFHNTAGSTNAVVPAGWTNSLNEDLGMILNQNQAQIDLTVGSVLKTAAVNKQVARNIYGLPSTNIGAV